MKAEELIKNNALQNIEVAGEQKVLFEEIALTAVNMARIEEKDRAYKALEFVLEVEVSAAYAKYILERFNTELEAKK